MKFKVDENLPAEVAAEIESAGHSANTVVQEKPSGAPDSEVVRVAASEQRIVVTLDKASQT